MTATNYEIQENILTLEKESESDVYHKELNLISWYGKPAKLDIRGWSDDHTKMTKGNQPHRGGIHKYRPGRA